MNTNKNVFYEQQLLAMKLADIFNHEIRKKLTLKKGKTVFPSTDSIYNKDIVLEQDQENQTSYSTKQYTSGSNYESYSNSNNKFRKKYEYDDYVDYYNDYNGSYQNEEVEYILVREKSDKFCGKNRKKNLSHLNKKDYLILNKGKSDDDINNTKYSDSNQQNLSGDNATTNGKMKDEVLGATSSDGTTTTNTNTTSIENTPTVVASKKNLYMKRDNSRFDFVNNDCKENNDSEVPNFISEMLYKKYSRYTFFRKFTCEKDKNCDVIYFEKELKNTNNSWVQFIKSNLNEKLKNNSS